jgi:hypothetical protein
LNSLFQSSNVFAKKLCSCLALSVVVLASVALLGSIALLTGGLRAVTSL